MAGGGMAGGGQAGSGMAGGGMAGGGVAGAQGGSGQDVCAPLAVGASWELGAKVPEQATLQPQVIAASGGVLLLGRPMRLWRVEGADFTLLGGEAPGAMKGSGISAAVVHDPVRNELVLFGNEPLSGALGDTWTLSLADLQWTQRCADCGVPPWKLGMARDAARDRIVLVSRLSTSVTSVSTSEWDGTSWARVCGEGAEPCAPGVVQAGSMAYDAARGVSVLVVFASATGPQTWEYDGAQPVAARWQQRSAPPEGLSGELRYDEARQRVTMAASKNSLEWDGDCWYYAHDPADALDASLAGLAHDPASNRTLAVGYSQAYGYFLATRADL